MNILLTSRNTTLNKLVRKATNSDWGHSSLVIDDLVYEFDYNKKQKKSLISVIKSPGIIKASIFYIDMLGRENDAISAYKKEFESGKYDIEAIVRLKDEKLGHRNWEDIQTSKNKYTCSSLIAKICHDQYARVGKTPDFLKYMHWSQVVPKDYENLIPSEQFRLVK